jgi:arginase
MTRLEQSYDSGHLPILIGGDHSVSIPSVSAAAKHLRKRVGSSADLGLVWVDAHPDLEVPETTRSGDLHGTPVAHLLGYGDPTLSQLGGFAPKLHPRNVVLIGLRDVMIAEREIIKERGIRAYSASDVEREGIAEICGSAFAMLSNQTAGFVLSFDIDACDPSEAPGVEYPERGGLTFREARLIMELAAEASGLISIEVVEVNPVMDPEGRTSELAMELIRSAVLGSPL